MSKIWKDVANYENYFMVSSEGDVYSKRTDKILKTLKNKKGYITISSKIGGRKGKAICLKVHRLVAEAFIPNPQSKPFINHKNGIKDCNHVSNLEWCTNLENLKHAVETGLIVGKKGCNNSRSFLSLRDINYIRNNYKPRDPIYGCRALAAQFSISHSQISRIVNRKSYN